MSICRVSQLPAIGRLMLAIVNGGALTFKCYHQTMTINHESLFHDDDGVVVTTMKTVMVCDYDNIP